MFSRAGGCEGLTVKNNHANMCVQYQIDGCVEPSLPLPTGVVKKKTQKRRKRKTVVRRLAVGPIRQMIVKGQSSNPKIFLDNYCTQCGD